MFVGVGREGFGEGGSGDGAGGGQYIWFVDMLEGEGGRGRKRTSDPYVPTREYTIVRLTLPTLLVSLSLSLLSNFAPIYIM